VTKLADGTMIYPLVAVDEPDFEVFARKHVEQKFPDYEFVSIVRQEQTSAGRAVLLSVRMVRKSEDTA